MGKFENTPYPGIRALLVRLKEDGFPLYVATSKPETTAVEILTKFGLDGFFIRICGASMDSSRDSKEDVLHYLMASLPQGLPALMIGDTVYDVEGAAACGLSTIGVSWGYGSVSEMEKAGAKAIVHTPEELYSLLSRQAAELCGNLPPN